MYVHLGGEISVPADFIIGIFDFEKLSEDKPSDILKFLKKAEEDGKVENVPGSLPLSVVLCLDRVYLSPLSAGILYRRMLCTDE